MLQIKNCIVNYYLVILILISLVYLLSTVCYYFGLVVPSRVILSSFRFGRHFKGCKGRVEAAEAEAEPMQEDDDGPDESDAEDEETRFVMGSFRFRSHEYWPVLWSRAFIKMVNFRVIGGTEVFIYRSSCQRMIFRSHLPSTSIQ